jgi:glucan-binding YG repeat protein
MMKEHKKLYKAGKNWLTATLTIAAVALLGGIATQKVSADSTPATAQTTTVQQTATGTTAEQQSQALSSADQTTATTQSAATDDSTTAVTVSQAKANAANQWAHYDQGWSYTDGQGNWVYNQWQRINNNWYYFNDAGYAQTGWFKSGAGNWYYFDNQNANALTSWQRINNHWYYFDPVNANAQTGWFKSGAGNWYYFDPTNAWADTGWQKINGSWYYFDNQNANALTGWQRLNNHWYYFDPANAWAQTGWFKSGAGNWYYFDSTNAWAETGWQKINGSWYYFDNQNANALTGWQKINNVWYYFDPVNAWMKTGWQNINGKSYYFNNSGAWSDPSSAYWNSTKQAKLDQYIQSYNSSHGTAFTKVNSNSAGSLVVNGDAEHYNDEGMPSGGTQSVGLSSDGQGSHAYNIVAIYNQNERGSHNATIGEFHNTYYFAYHNGQPVVLFDCTTNGWPVPSDQQHLTSYMAKRATAITDFNNAFTSIANS